MVSQAIFYWGCCPVQQPIVDWWTRNRPLRGGSARQDPFHEGQTPQHTMQQKSIKVIRIKLLHYTNINIPSHVKCSQSLYLSKTLQDIPWHTLLIVLLHETMHVLTHSSREEVASSSTYAIKSWTLKDKMPFIINKPHSTSLAQRLASRPAIVPTTSTCKL